MPKELEPPPCPDEIKYLWQWFGDLSRGRNYTGMGSPLPLSSTEILSWMTITKIRLTPWELDVIKSMDSIHLQSVNEQIKNRPKPGNKR
jgi:hypothetical protein